MDASEAWRHYRCRYRPPVFTPPERCARAHEIVAGMPQRPEIKEGMGIPCYNPGPDTVHMPERVYFESEEAYMSTLFHELAHSTGHQSRLALKSLMENKGVEAAGEAKRCMQKRSRLLKWEQLS